MLFRSLSIAVLLSLGCSSSEFTVAEGTADSSSAEDSATDTATDTIVAETPGVSCVDKAEGTVCGTGMICRSAGCLPSFCGDGFVDRAAGEECEDGNSVAGDGCEPKTC